ncbi:MAG TPA: hypothetical protein VNX88_12905 [Terriglobales bacterium]|nr:hypothetical protein [Terriglobales bacterium]
MLSRFRLVVVLLLAALPVFAVSPKTVTSSQPFTDINNNALANGSIVFKLANPDLIVGGPQVVQGLTYTITLDANGLVPAGKTIWATDQMQSTGNYYTVTIYNSNNLPVRGTENWRISGTSPIDLSLQVNATLPDPGLSNPVLQNPAAPQTITGQGMTLTKSAPLTLARQNNKWFADQWCTTPGTLDQSCIQNAINDVLANGPIGSSGRHMGIVVVSPGVYNIASTITVTGGGIGNVEIRGSGQVSNWGSVLEPTVGLGSGCVFQVNADAVTIDNLVITGVNNQGVPDGICLGTSSVETFDSHIYWNWYQYMHTAIHGVKYSGGEFAHNTIELGQFGIAGGLAGDVAFTNVLIDDNRIFQNSASGIFIHGDGTAANYGHNSVDNNLLDFNTNSGVLANTGQIDFASVINYRITNNTFNSNNACCSTSNIDDIKVATSNAGYIGGNNHYNTGRNVLNLNGNAGLTLNGDSSRNCNVNSNGGTTAAVVADNMTNFTVSGITTTADAAKNLCTYSISVGAASSGTKLGLNNVIAQQTAKYSILDTTASAIDGGQFSPTGPGNSTSGTSLGVIGSDGAATAGNLYGWGVNKSGVDGVMFGVNKNTTTGSIPGSAVYFSSAGTGSVLCFGRGNGSGLPNTCDLQINGSGQIVSPTLVTSTIVTGIVGDGSGFKHKRISTGSIGATTRTEVLLSWTTTFADANYTVSCAVEDSTTAAATQGLTYERIRTHSASQVGAVINNPTAGAITGTLDCTAAHD